MDIINIVNYLTLFNFGPPLILGPFDRPIVIFVLFQKLIINMHKKTVPSEILFRFYIFLADRQTHIFSSFAC